MFWWVNGDMNKIKIDISHFAQSENVSIFWVALKRAEFCEE